MKPIRQIIREEIERVLSESYYDKDKLYSRQYIENVTKNADNNIKRIVRGLQSISCTDSHGNQLECVKIPEILFVYISGKY